MKNLSKLGLLCLIVTLSSCIRVAKPFDKLPPGVWHAEFALSDDVALPFIMETSYDEHNELHIHVINGDERIEVMDVSFGRDDRLQDTVVMNFPLMDSHIKAIYKENVMEGIWTVRNKDDYHVPFVAYHGQDFRFSHNSIKPITDVSGKWKTTFGIETENAYPAVGEFKTESNKLTGTFRTETGDYRFLEGEIQGDDFKMSCFDGSHAFLFTAKVQEDGSLLGKFYSGNHYQTNWAATKDDNVTLTDAFNLTKPLQPQQLLEISLPNTDGKIVTLNDEKYKGKPKLISVMGTWCPNCLDESRFLKEYLQKHPEKKVEVLAIAFERYKDEQQAVDMIKRYKDRLEVPYEILYGGYYSKSKATEVLKVVDKIISYPTLFFVNSDNTISSIYTGFSGPATSEYDNFKKSFEEELEKILK